MKNSVPVISFSANKGLRINPAISNVTATKKGNLALRQLVRAPGLLVGCEDQAIEGSSLPQQHEPLDGGSTDVTLDPRLHVVRFATYHRPDIEQVDPKQCERVHGADQVIKA